MMSESHPSSGAAQPSTPEAQPEPAPQSSANSEMSAELEREIADAMAHLDAEDASARAAAKGRRGPKAPAQARPAQPSHPAIPGAKPAIRGPRVVKSGREHRPGKVVSVGPTDIFIEFGPKELGVCPRVGWPEDQLPNPGDTVEVAIERFEADEQLFICSRPGAVAKADWELLEPGQTVEARVTGVNKGGLELEVANHRAFMPASQVDTRRIEDLSVFIGQKLTCVVDRVERTGKGNIVLSRRDLVKEERSKQAEKTRAELAEGQTREGVVRKLMPFGAFVDIGGVDGLLHVADMSYDRVGDPSRIVKEGDTITVKVLKVDAASNKISLGLKQLQGDPFQTAAENVKAGETVTGRVTKIMEFGAFVEVAPGVEGLVHISEISWKRIGAVGDALKPDQVVACKVLEVDPSKRRVSLSIKQTTEAPPAPGGGGKDARGRTPGRTIEEIKKETPEFRRLREKFIAQQKAKGPLKGGM